jgi:endoglucanase
MHTSRRDFLKTTVAAAAAATLTTSAFAADAPAAISAAKLPRWRGFNLLEKFTAGRNNSAYKESDFEWIAEWGFDFVRLPMSYLCWGSAVDPFKIDESKLTDIDKAVEMGKQHKIHVNLNFHRAPGYCVNPPKEALDLWTDSKALDACAKHWAFFSARYKGIPSTQLSFDLLNEPSDLPEAQYAKVVRRLVADIRAADPQRLVIADGLKWGNSPVMSLADLGIGQSTRGYAPMQISHYKATWINGSDKYAIPTWPLKLEKDGLWDKARLAKKLDPWKALAAKGVGIHVGEWGPYQYTPHDVALAWMKDNLDLWKEAGWGWSMWNFKGGFGILDSNRKDVAYEDFHGRKLDRKMLELVRSA